MERAIRDETFVQAVDRALQILEYLGSGKALKLAAIAEGTGLHKTTAYRLVQTLVRRGYVVAVGEGSYRLGLRLVGLSSALLDSFDLRDVARPELQRVLDDTNETVHLVVLEQGEIVYIEKLEGTQTVRMHSLVGRRVPAHCTGVGKVILAHLPTEDVYRILQDKGLPAHTRNTISDPVRFAAELDKVRRLGYALDLEENEEGINCAAAPVRDHLGHVVAAISVSAPKMRLGPDRLSHVARLVISAAANVSSALGAPAAAAGGGEFAALLASSRRAGAT